MMGDDTPARPNSGPPCDEEAIRFLREIVAIPSPSTAERQVTERIVAALAEWGLAAHRDEVGNAVGTAGEGEVSLLMLGHIDTVPGEVPVRQEGGLLYGRGAVDAKGPFAAFCVAAARVAHNAGLKVTVVGAVEEEAATSLGAYHLVAHHPRPDYVIIGEPSSWNRVTLGYKGRLLIDYTLRQEMAHTAGQETGVCEQAVAFWTQLNAWAEQFNADREGRFATLDPSLRGINSDGDGLWQEVRMGIGLRLPLECDLDELAALVASWAGPATVTTRGYEQPFRAEKRNALTSAFLSSIRAEGDRATFVTKTGTSDMNVVGPRWGCPIVAYGPGDSTLDHTPHEHIDLAEYLRSIRVLERVLLRLGQA